MTPEQALVRAVVMTARVVVRTQRVMSEAVVGDDLDLACEAAADAIGDLEGAVDEYEAYRAERRQVRNVAAGAE